MQWPLAAIRQKHNMHMYDTIIQVLNCASMPGTQHATAAQPVVLGSFMG
jgi:RNA-splicing ligase RtcB